MKVERESQLGGSEFQVAAVLNDRLANDVRRNSTHSSGTDDDRVLRARFLALNSPNSVWRPDPLAIESASTPPLPM